MGLSFHVGERITHLMDDNLSVIFLTKMTPALITKEAFIKSLILS